MRRSLASDGPVEPEASEQSISYVRRCITKMTLQRVALFESLAASFKIDGAIHLSERVDSIPPPSQKCAFLHESTQLDLVAH